MVSLLQSIRSFSGFQNIRRTCLFSSFCGRIQQQAVLKTKVADDSKRVSSQYQIAKLLLDANANPHIRDNQGFTVLDKAVMRGWPEDAKLLLIKYNVIHSRKFYLLHQPSDIKS